MYVDDQLTRGARPVRQAIVLLGYNDPPPFDNAAGSKAGGVPVQGNTELVPSPSGRDRTAPHRDTHRTAGRGKAGRSGDRLSMPVLSEHAREDTVAAHARERRDDVYDHVMFTDLDASKACPSI